MATIVTTAIQGRIVAPDGIGVNGGLVTFTLSVPCRAKDSDNKTVIVAQTKTVTISQAGEAAVGLMPTANLHHPGILGAADTTYAVNYAPGTAPTKQKSWDETVTVPASGPVEIGDLPLA